MVLVYHEWATSLNLGLHDGVPKLLRFDSLPCSALTLIFVIELLELFAPDFMKARCLIRTEQGPILIGLDTFHTVEPVSRVT